MNEQARTPWFPCTTPPVRRGEYEFRYKDHGVVLRTRFNGQFQIPRRSVHGRFEWRSFGCLLNHLPENYEWRGLAKEPK